MKNIVLASLLLFCFPVLSQNILNKQMILERILSTPEIYSLLSLENLTDRSPVRIIDRTKKFKGINFLFKAVPEQKGIPVNVGVIYQYPLDLNTGYFRDMSILGFKKKHETYNVDIYLASYRCSGDKRNRWHINIDLGMEKGNITVLSLTKAEWH